jgi:hypothetical protein
MGHRSDDAIVKVVQINLRREACTGVVQRANGVAIQDVQIKHGKEDYCDILFSRNNYSVKT